MYRIPGTRYVQVCTISVGSACFTESALILSVVTLYYTHTGIRCQVYVKKVTDAIGCVIKYRYCGTGKRYELWYV